MAASSGGGNPVVVSDLIYPATEKHVIVSDGSNVIYFCCVSPQQHLSTPHTINSYDTEATMYSKLNYVGDLSVIIPGL